MNDHDELIDQVENLELTIQLLKDAIEKLNVDQHVFQDRPCQTCRRISKLTGGAFGCNQIAAQTYRLKNEKN